MRIHVCLMQPNGMELPVSEWDFVRHAGDNQIPEIIDSIPHKEKIIHEVSCPRPNDVEQFRKVLKHTIPDNHERWDRLCDLLAKYPEIYMYFVF